MWCFSLHGSQQELSQMCVCTCGCFFDSSWWRAASEARCLCSRPVTTQRLVQAAGNTLCVLGEHAPGPAYRLLPARSGAPRSDLTSCRLNSTNCCCLLWGMTCQESAQGPCRWGQGSGTAPPAPSPIASLRTKENCYLSQKLIL